jgi:hypothetical protein
MTEGWILSGRRADCLASSGKFHIEDKTEVRPSRAGFAVKTRLRSGDDEVRGQILRWVESTGANVRGRRNWLARGRIRLGLSDFHRPRARDSASGDNLSGQGVLRIVRGGGGEGRSHQSDGFVDLYGGAVPDRDLQSADRALQLLGGDGRTRASAGRRDNLASLLPTFNSNGTVVGTPTVDVGANSAVPGTDMLLVVMYPWPVYGGPLGLNFSNMGGGKMLMTSTQVFRIEPTAPAG